MVLHCTILGWDSNEHLKGMGLSLVLILVHHTVCNILYVTYLNSGLNMYDFESKEALTKSSFPMNIHIHLLMGLVHLLGGFSS